MAGVAPVVSTLLVELADPVRESSIQRWWFKRKKEPVVPWLSVLIGADEKSCGASVYACHKAAGGSETVVEPLVSVRWREHPETVEDLVLLAQKALRTLAFERGWKIAE